LAKLISRKYQPGDEIGILKIYNLITNRDRTVEQHLWEWQYAFKEPVSSWVILKQATEEIVGHHGLIPFEVNYFGRILSVGRTENTVLHPDYLGSGIYFLHERKFCEEAKTQFDMLLTTVGYGAPGKIRRRLGYKPVGAFICLIRICGILDCYALIRWKLKKIIRPGFISILLSLSISIPAMFFATLFLPKFFKRDPDLTLMKIDSLDTIVEEFENFLAANKEQLGISINRTINFLQWRIFNNPYINHIMLIARKNDRIVGYVIGSFIDNNPYMTIVDILVENNDKAIFNTLIDSLKKRCKTYKIPSLSFPTLESNNFLNSQLKEMGFSSFKILHKIITYLSRFFRKSSSDPASLSQAYLLVKSCNDDKMDERLYNPDEWYFTYLFAEGVN